MMEPPWLVARHRASGWTRPTGALETLRLPPTLKLRAVPDQGRKSFGFVAVRQPVRVRHRPAHASAASRHVFQRAEGFWASSDL